MSAFAFPVKPRVGVAEDGVIAMSPDLVIAVLPFAKKPTWKGSDDSVSENEALKIGDIELIDAHCTDVNISHSKQSHTSSMNGVFLDPTNVFHKKFAPGDWMFVWMFDNPEDAASVRSKIKNLEPCNEFWDGLKFAGRVFSVRRVVQLSPNGIASRRVSITGIAFSEFDSLIYFDPFMAVENRKGMLFQRNLVNDVNGLASQGIISTMSAMPKLFNTFLGGGPGREAVQLGGKMTSPNRAFLIPEEVGKLLGRTKAKGQLDYAHIVESYFGIHKYNGNSGEDYKGFIPNSTGTDRQHLLKPSLEGTFSAQVTPWTGVPIWSILNQFSNGPVNEMYTTLRVAQDGKVVPNFIVRQIPFSTDRFAQKSKSACTAFRSLPRWKLPLEMIQQFDSGTSNSLRVNYVHVRAQPLIAVRYEAAIFRDQVDPSFDPVDVNRNGMYGMIATINSTTSAAAGTQNAFYTQLMADCLIHGHLRMSGTVNAKGIQAPIAVGDNLEFDDGVYHIEGISHMMQVAPGSGRKTFNTTLTLSHGVPIDPEEEFLDIAGKPEASVTNTPQSTEDLYVGTQDS